MSFDRAPELVSVVIPGCNQAQYADDCFGSLLRQTYRNIEIVVVDDASTDGLEHRVSGFQEAAAAAGIAVVSVRLPRRIGYAGALTIGMFLTRGEYIALQDLDDISDPKRFEMQVDYLKSHPDIDLVGTNVEWFHDNDFQRRTVCYWIEYGNDIKESLALGRPSLCTSSILFRGVVFDNLGGLTRTPYGSEDVNLIRKYVINGIAIDNLREVLYYARQHGHQRSRLIQSKTHRPL
ncbi:glycosyltransferase family 2 protein [Alicyclobacillus acidiphilus]|uniref:glycosyltransferase family 2 protein n=1 Tax=Alicyclobacillus acidiphilus TaxID=182455 RepID=UPI0008304314|nr:glycosyltransferase family 2 protein [Alicyclobacillus acidiphilus]